MVFTMPEVSKASVPDYSPIESEQSIPLELKKKIALDHYLCHINELEAGTGRLCHRLGPRAVETQIIKLHQELMAFLETDPADAEAMERLDNKFRAICNELADKAGGP